MVKQESREAGVEEVVQGVTRLVAVDSAVSSMRSSVVTHHLAAEEVNVNRLVRNVGQI